MQEVFREYVWSEIREPWIGKHDVSSPTSLTLFMPLTSPHCIRTPLLFHKKRFVPSSCLRAFPLLFLLPQKHYAANLHPPSPFPSLSNLFSFLTHPLSLHPVTVLFIPFLIFNPICNQIFNPVLIHLIVISSIRPDSQTTGSLSVLCSMNYAHLAQILHTAGARD